MATERKAAVSVEDEIRLRGVKSSVNGYLDTDFVRADFARQLQAEIDCPRQGRAIMTRAIPLAESQARGLLAEHEEAV